MARPRERIPDIHAAADAVRAFLEALGVDPSEPDLQATPERVARAWIEVLVAGQRVDPSTALGDLHPAPDAGPVLVTEVPFISVCPHHLLPLVGRADFAFVPNGRVPGFGRIAQLLDALAHRLVLQENLTSSFVDEFQRHVEPKACVAVLRARHTCVAVTDPVRMNVPFTTIASRGDPELARATLELFSARRA